MTTPLDDTILRPAEDQHAIDLADATPPEPLIEAPPQETLAPEKPAAPAVPAQPAEPAEPVPSTTSTLKGIKDLLIEQGKMPAEPRQPMQSVAAQPAQPAAPAKTERDQLIEQARALESHQDPEIRTLAKLTISAEERALRAENEAADLRARYEGQEQDAADVQYRAEVGDFLKHYQGISAKDYAEVIEPAWEQAVKRNEGLATLTPEEWTARLIGRDALDARRTRATTTAPNGNGPAAPLGTGPTPRPPIVTQPASGGGPIRRPAVDRNTSNDQAEARMLSRLRTGR